MTRKDYDLIVRVITRTVDNFSEASENGRWDTQTPEPAEIYSELIHNFASELQRENERFDVSKFFNALKF